MEMKEQAEKFRRQVLERGEVGPRTRYTAEQRQEAVAYMRARQQQGASREEAAKELGVSSWTLSRWGSDSAPCHPGGAREGSAGPRGGEGRGPRGQRGRAGGARAGRSAGGGAALEQVASCWRAA